MTAAPELKFALQALPQLIPDGELVTVPVPAPVLVTFRENWVGGVVTNPASAVCAAFMVTMQVVADPEHAPDQPENVLPAAGASVRMTAVPGR